MWIDLLSFHQCLLIPYLFIPFISCELGDIDREIDAVFRTREGTECIWLFQLDQFEYSARLL